MTPAFTSDTQSVEFLANNINHASQEGLNARAWSFPTEFSLTNSEYGLPGPISFSRIFDQPDDIYSNYGSIISTIEGLGFYLCQSREQHGRFITNEAFL
ncbi:hypothetical protein O181_035773 [Austropuccinia psidii MF-1]|uniref:Uncharacterized protein n=1 Tax=Austropuccinia psidii MF-1 TaxID=1389203 RepID=A0A9Q3H8J8_9BASI|nr:hypothetical protein [Austropuccinia psidii MF-1]